MTLRRVPSHFMATPSDRLTRFSDRAKQYALHRPTYSASAIDIVLEGLAPPHTLQAADIGAGTGISARLLAERGTRVIALEPNDAMRQRGQQDAIPNVQWRSATGESTGLPDASLDLILCAQAFHWLEAPRALADFRRILKPGARAAIIWNILDRNDTASNSYLETVKAHAKDPPTSPWFTGSRDPFAHATGWIHARKRSATHTQTLTLDGLHGRALSASYSPNSGAARDALIADLTALFAKHALNDMLVLRYQTDIYLAENQPQTLHLGPASRC